MNLSEFSIRLAVALLAGFLIGFERKWSHKSTGLRTHGLVAVGAAIFVLLSVGLTEDGQGDSTRIIGQVVVGIGFLGAGVILRDGLNIQGLSSAATIWCSAAIGCLAGSGWYPEVAIATGAILFVNIVFSSIEEWLDRKHEALNKK